MELFADVILNRKSAAIDRIFTYRVPEEMAGQLCCGMLVLAPLNREKIEAIVVALHHSAPEGYAVRDLLSIESEKPLFAADLLQLSTWMSRYYLCSRAAALLAMLPAGLTLSGRAPRVFYQEVWSLAPEAAEARPSPKRLHLQAYLAQQPQTNTAQLKEAGFSRAFLLAAEKAGLICRSQQRLLDDEPLPPAEPAALSAEQQTLFAAIVAEQKGQNRPFLIRGVTGSGKTELYLRLVRRLAESGRQSIVLVPEIALSAQMVEMLQQRLELPVAVLHSGLKSTERRQIWQDIAEGRYTCVVGARSAVFAPLPQLGLIIVDEAHETSYKQDNTPRFSAVETAEKRAELAGASLVLGSATPSVEQYWAAKSGRFALGELKERFHGAPPPTVELKDMRRELRQGNKSIFSLQVQDALAETLAAKEQAVLFLNRRGYYQHYACRDCGTAITCPHCAVAMSYHETQQSSALKCHYCGRRITPPSHCPTCGSAHIRKFGVGTQRVADELQRLFPEARILRLDSDVTEVRGSHERIYHAMRNYEADFLVGTQMVAKGLDFPKLSLAVVVSADTLLNLPDWRAGERTYQLVTQLAGRAGRREKQGRAFVQTYTPEAAPLQAAAAGDYPAFFQAEVEKRDLHGYPPFSHLIRLLFTAGDREKLAASCRSFAHYLRAELSGASELCGPAEAPLSKIKDRFRRQIIVRCPDVAEAAAAISRAEALWRAGEKLPRDLLLIKDVDPLSVM